MQSRGTFSDGLHDMARSEHPEPNPAASVDAPIASLFVFLRQWRRATDQRRWAADYREPRIEL
jgi:hypothetical protein